MEILKVEVRHPRKHKKEKSRLAGEIFESEARETGSRERVRQMG